MSFPMQNCQNPSGPTGQRPATNYENVPQVKLEPKQQTLMWQQDSYHIDSGLESGATSHTQSLSGRSDEGGGSRMPLPRSMPYFDPPPNKNKEQTMMWQQDSYPSDSGVVSYMDSGVVSGCTTETQSLCGQELDDPALYEWSEYPDGFAQLDSLSHQLDPVAIKNEVSSLENMCQVDRPPSGYASPMPKIDNNNVEIVDNVAPLTKPVIPRLIQLLCDQDQVVVSEAANMLLKFSKKENCRDELIDYSVIAALVKAMSTSNDADTVRYSAGTLHNLSCNSQALQIIVKCGGIPGLVKLLSSQIESVLFYAITTLHNFLLYQGETKTSMRSAGAVKKMVDLLDRNNVKFLTIVTDCLRILASGHQESKQIILSSDGPLKLFGIMGSNTDEKLLWTTSKLIKVLPLSSQTKPAIVQAGGVFIMFKLLSHPSQRLVQNCLWILRSLSDAATKLEDIDPLLERLVLLLGSNDPAIVTCAAGALSNIICNNQHNKRAVCRFEGIKALVQILLHMGESVEITELVVCALRHLTSGNAESDVAQYARKGLHSCIPLITKLLTLPIPHYWPVIKAAVGLIRNLALFPPNSVEFREKGALKILIQLLMHSHKEMQGGATTFAEGVKVAEIVEGTTGVLLVLIRDEMNKAIVRDQQVIPVMVQLLTHVNENIQRAAVGVLTELSTDKQTAFLIKQEGAAGPLTDLLNSKNEGLSGEAKNLLCNLLECRAPPPRPGDVGSSALPRDVDEMWEQGCLANIASMFSNDGNFFHDSSYQGARAPTTRQQGFDEHHELIPQLEAQFDDFDNDYMDMDIGTSSTDMNFKPMDMVPPDGRHGVHGESMAWGNSNYDLP